MDNKRNTKIINLKKRTPKNETWYKEYKNLSETIKRKSKTYYYSDQFMIYKDNIEKTREVRKRSLGKQK